MAVDKVEPLSHWKTRCKLSCTVWRALKQAGRLKLVQMASKQSGGCKLVCNINSTFQSYRSSHCLRERKNSRSTKFNRLSCCNESVWSSEWGFNQFRNCGSYLPHCIIQEKNQKFTGCQTWNASVMQKGRRLQQLMQCRISLKWNTFYDNLKQRSDFKNKWKHQRVLSLIFLNN